MPTRKNAEGIPCVAVQGGCENTDDRRRYKIFEDLNIAVRAPNDANGSTVRSSHVSEDGRMILAPLVNIQKTSRRRNA